MNATTLSQDLLFEIGTEELPTKAVRALSEALAHSISSELETNNLSFSEIVSFGTPRRIAVLVKNLAVEQLDYIIEKRGPALNAAYDSNNNLTPAALGFAKSCGASADQLSTLETEKGSWLIYKQLVKGKKTTTLLSTVVNNAVKKLPIPKPMRWNNHDFVFARPVHWLVLLFGEEIVELTLLGVQSNNKTYGHRFLSPDAISITHAKDYEALLHQNYVIACFNKRANIIKSQIEDLAKNNDAIPIIKEHLLQEVTALVEWPEALMGSFHSKFLQVPQECLIISMESHQKYFPLLDKENNLKPDFIFISNIISKNPSQVIQGNQRVLSARLADAEFFFENDKKIKLTDRQCRLQNITYQRKLGNLFDKSLRIKSLCSYIGEQLQKLSLTIDLHSLEEAAKLCKTDLTTEMVYEFPELQGIMGKYYALNDQLNSIIASSLEQYYYPKQAGDKLPDLMEASILSIADKIDTLVGIFAIGETPTGDKDPFGLRRATLGILRILIEQKLPLDLKDLISHAVENFANILQLSSDQQKSITENCLTFCFERLKNYYLDQDVALNLFYTLYNTAKNIAITTSPYDLNQRLLAVKDFQKLPEATQLIAANKRVNNIIGKLTETYEEQTINTNYLQEPAEIKLYSALKEKAVELKPMFQAQDYNYILKSLASLQEPIDNFFDNVMVMCEDEKIKINRILLLKEIQNLFNNIADISELQ